MGLETHNLILNSSSSVMFMLIWPFTIVAVVALTPLAKCPLFNKIRQRLIRTFLIGFLIRGFLEEALDLLVNAFLCVKQGYVDPNGEKYSLLLSVFILCSFSLSVVLIPFLLIKNQDNLEDKKGAFSSLYY